MLLSAIKKREEIFPGLYSDLWTLNPDPLILKDDINHYAAEMIISEDDFTLILNGAAYFSEFFNLRYLEIHFVDKFGSYQGSYIKLNLEYLNYKNLGEFYKLNFKVKRVTYTDDIIL